jgi:tetratricopeptide (TPR) repeat protein
MPLPAFSRSDDTDAVLETAAAFERAGKFARALSCYAQIDDRESVLRLLKRHGMALVESGHAELVRDCMDRFGGEVPQSAMLLATNAVLEAQIGRYDTAEAWFKRAIALASDPEVKGSIVYRWSLDALRRGKTECIAELERYGNRSCSLTAALQATLATAYAIVNRTEDARRWVWCARATLESQPLAAMEQARTIHQIAFVALRCGEFLESKQFATQAVDLALREENYDLAARAYSVLYELAYSIECDNAEARKYVDLVARNTAKSGDAKARVWALCAALAIEAERGDTAAMRKLEYALDEVQLVQYPDLGSDVLLPVTALRSAWSGNFTRAYQLLAESAEAQPTADTRAKRFSEVALYAAAGGMNEEARAAIESADWALIGSPPLTGLALQARAALVLATAISLGVERARTRLDGLRDERNELPASVLTLVHAVRSILDNWDGASNGFDVLESFASMRAAHLGGIARVFEMLPAPTVS